MQLGLGLGLTHVQQAGGGESEPVILEVIDENGNTEITEYVNNDVTEVQTYIDFTGCSSLANFQCSSLKAIGTVENVGVFFIGCALPQAIVDAILVQLASFDGTNGTVLWENTEVNLSGGTSAAPSATGRAAKVVLEGRGCTVNDNGTIAEIIHSGDAGLISLSAYDDITNVLNSFNITACPNLDPVVEMVSLRVVGAGLGFVNNDTVTGFSCPLGEQLANVNISGNEILVDIDLPLLISTLQLQVSENPSLTDFSIPETVVQINGNAHFHENALTQTAVDAILEKLVALDGTGETTLFESLNVDLSGGTNAIPSAAGLTAKATLEGRGCTVTVNS